MKIPKIIKKNGRKYIFVKRVNKDVFLYESIYGYKECFSRYDLDLIEEQPKIRKVRPRYIK